MKKGLILLIMLGVFSFEHIYACDACGCSFTGGSAGLMTAYRSNFIRLGWNVTSFKAISEYENASTDNFHTFTLSGQYHITDKIKAMIILPYRVNIRSTNGQTISLNGISDVQITGNYVFSNHKKIGKQTQLYLEIGAGVKMPTGRYDPHIHNSDLPDNFNTGNGNCGLIARPNVVVSKGNSGLVFSGNYLFSTKSDGGYRYGHQLTSSILFYWEKELSEKIKFIPNVGSVVELIGIDHYSNGNDVHGTGGKGLFITPSVNLKLENYFLGISFSQPVADSYSNGEVKSAGRFTTQFSYLFKKKIYLDEKDIIFCTCNFSYSLFL